MRILNLIVILGLMGLAMPNTLRGSDLAGEAITKEFGKKYRVQSKVLGEERELLIRLPAGYEASEKDYPVIYVLDGDGHFEHISLAVETLQEADRLPGNIIVAIPNLRGTRGRDLFQEKEKFRQFIREEVFTFVTTNFRASDNRAIFGHSMAGGFVLTTLADNPDMFDIYIASSPGTDDLIELTAKYSQRTELQDKFLYFTIGQAENERFIQEKRTLASLLEKAALPNLSWHFEPLAGQAHMTVQSLTAFMGLSRAYLDFQDPKFLNYQDFLNRGGMTAVKAHFAKRGTKYAMSPDVSECMIVGITRLLMAEGNPEKTVEFVKAYIEQHPTSVRIISWLARTYRGMNEVEKAIEVLKEAVVMAQKVSPNRVGGLEMFIKSLEKQLSEASDDASPALSAYSSPPGFPARRHQDPDWPGP